MKITEYWRSHQQWSKYLGQKGRVVATSMMEVAASDQSTLVPYAYVLVELEQEQGRISVMGAAGEQFMIGDQVELVLRKIKKEHQHEVIVYGLKATHLP